MVAEEWTFRWQEGLTNFESFDYETDAGEAVALTDYGAEFIIRARPRGTTLLSVNDEDVDELVEITITEVAGNVTLEIDPELFTGKNWPDTARASLNLIRPDGVKIPFVRGPVVIVKE